MDFKIRRFQSFFFLTLFSDQCFAQVRLKADSILDRSEAYQRQFVSDYLSDGKAGILEGYPSDINYNEHFWLLSKCKDWVLPITEARLVEWLSDPEKNNAAINNVVNTVESTGTIQVFDLIARVFAKRPELNKWIQQNALTGYGSADPNFIVKWYHALEYADPEVRRIAREAILSMLQNPPPLNDNFYYVWGAALIERHGHEPTALEIMRDPILELVRLVKEENSEVIRQKLAKVSKEIYALKQVDGKKKIQ